MTSETNITIKCKKDNNKTICNVRIETTNEEIAKKLIEDIRRRFLSQTALTLPEFQREYEAVSLMIERGFTPEFIMKVFPSFTREEIERIKREIARKKPPSGF